MLGIFHAFCQLIFFEIIFFQKILSGIPLEYVSNSLDPDQAHCIVGPNLGPNFTVCKVYQQMTLVDKS